MAVDHKDQSVADTAPVFERKMLDAETFQAWQSELNDFIAVTHDRLESLSQSLSRRGRVQTGNPDTRGIGAQSETETLSPIVDHPPATTAEQTGPPTEPPAGRNTDTDADTEATRNNVVDQESMDRLNAIKRRLATQMRNAS